MNEYMLLHTHFGSVFLAHCQHKVISLELVPENSTQMHGRRHRGDGGHRPPLESGWGGIIPSSNQMSIEVFELLFLS